ncbi:MAG: HAD-IA family hydrolase [Roseiflexaceae bacterium]|nr:HAD-IA family hydrolase [Roseiflexaceae bacterium]
MLIEALIFDFDGLVVDTETPEYEVLSQQYREQGAILLPERWVLGLGTVGGYNAYAELEALIGHPVDRDALHIEHRQRYLKAIAAQPLRPGIAILLEYGREHGLRMAVASSSNRDWVEGWLASHAIREYFGCVRTRNDVANVKPAPDLFLSAAECLGVVPQACVVLEDSPNGMRAAASAGMRCVAVPLPLLSGLDLPPHTMRLTTLADLRPQELLERLNHSDGVSVTT